MLTALRRRRVSRLVRRPGSAYCLQTFPQAWLAAILDLHRSYMTAVDLPFGQTPYCDFGQFASCSTESTPPSLPCVPGVSTWAKFLTKRLLERATLLFFKTETNMTSRSWIIIVGFGSCSHIQGQVGNYKQTRGGREAVIRLTPPLRNLRPCQILH